MNPFGLTGGIGCGKTTLGEMFRERGWMLIDTDEIAHRLMEPQQENWKNVIDVFGDSILNKESSINRRLLADLVFANPPLRQKLNEAVHPAIRRAWLKEVDEAKTNHSQNKILVVIPLLFETEAEKEFSKVLCIGAARAVQEKRLKTRGWASSQIQQRIESQLSLEEKMKKSDVIFWNNGSLQTLAQQLDQFLTLILT